MLGVTPEMAFFFYSFFKLSIFCRLDEKFDGVCQQLPPCPEVPAQMPVVGSRPLMFLDLIFLLLHVTEQMIDICLDCHDLPHIHLGHVF